MATLTPQSASFPLAENQSCAGPTSQHRGRDDRPVRLGVRSGREASGLDWLDAEGVALRSSFRPCHRFSERQAPSRGKSTTRQKWESGFLRSCCISPRILPPRTRVRRRGPHRRTCAVELPRTPCPAARGSAPLPGKKKSQSARQPASLEERKTSGFSSRNPRPKPASAESAAAAAPQLGVPILRERYGSIELDEH